MKRKLCLPLAVVALAFGLRQPCVAAEVRVNADRVNLRAAPTLSVEAVAQVDKGVVLNAGVTNGDWLAVTPPETANVCIHAELVRDGVVSVSKAMVRGGPGVNYRPVGTLQQGDTVNVRGTSGDWLQIEPPPGCALWISRQYVDSLSQPAESAGEAVLAAPETAMPPRPASAGPPTQETPVPKPPMPESRGQARQLVSATALPPVERREPVAPAAAPERLPGSLAAWVDAKNLASSKAQGREVLVSGVLRRAFIVWRRPSRFCLVNFNANGVAVMSCYVAGNQQQLAGLKGRHLAVYGHEYWIQGVRHPVVVADRIVRHD